MSKFTLNSVLGSLVMSGALVILGQSNLGRAPASQQGFELELKSVSLDAGSKLRSLENAFIRATFNKTDVLELGTSDLISMKQGDRKDLKITIPVKAQWLENDELEFKIEIVERGPLFEHIALRCATVTQNVSSFNRTFQCMVPGEATSILNYRLGKKGDGMANFAGR
jgi:hypothetical protein